MLYDLLAAAIGEYAAWSGRDAHRSTRRNTAMVAIAPQRGGPLSNRSRTATSTSSLGRAVPPISAAD